MDRKSPCKNWGNLVVRNIPYGRQDISAEDIDAVINVLRSDWLTQGPVVPQFENAITEYCGANFAVAVNSATSALHIACLSLGLGSGDWLWTSPISFVASANCGLYCGARVDFIDIDPHTYNVCMSALEEKLRIAKKKGVLPKVVVPVHFAGQSCDMKRVRQLADEYNFKIIEDASHAIGARYQNEPAGNCRYSDITVFSFHPVKIITTGEGGVAITNDAKLASRMQIFRSHGITRNLNEMMNQNVGPWYYEQIELGFNYRMTDIQAALGLSQLQRLDKFVDARQSIAKKYNIALASLPVTIPWQDPDSYSSFHLYVIRLKTDAIKKTRLEVFESMRALGIGVNVHYIPIYHQPFFKNRHGFDIGYCPNAEAYYREAISLPMYPSLVDAEFDYVVDSLHQALGIK